ncbi:MAG: hypothetical protein KA764_12700 [Anaerolineales bacterium]|nr:hypothetical protein [Anaerolineales bacterium]
MRVSISLLALALFTAACAAEPAATPAPTPARVDAVPAQLAAIKALSVSTGVPVDQVRVLSTERVDWPDGCLGVPATETACPAAATPGFRIMLEAAGQRHRFHTTLTGSAVVEAPAEVRLTWHREGGLAGFCDVLTVTTAGAAQAGACNANPATAPLTAEEVAQLRQWAEQYGPVVIVIGDPGAADSMLMSLEMDGAGAAQPDEAAQQALLEWSQTVFTRLAPP